MYRTLFALLVVVAPTVAFGAETDPRALESCKAQSPTFVQIADCLPGADIAYKTLDAFETIYPVDALPLKEKCVQLNEKSIVGAATCVTSAIDSALKLQQSLPKNSELNDPIFKSLTDASMKEKLDAKIDLAKSAFPDAPLWGLTSYYPYK